MRDIVEGLFSFKGRMTRSEFWLIGIGIGIVTGGLLMASSMIVLAIVGAAGAETFRPVHEAVKALIQLATLWPTLAVLTKRGHDRNRPLILSIGLWLATIGLSVGAVFAPVLFNGIILIWLYFLVDYGFIEGTRGPNRYGPSPKGYGPKAPPLNLSDVEPAPTEA